MSVQLPVETMDVITTTPGTSQIPTCRQHLMVITRKICGLNLHLLTNFLAFSGRGEPAPDSMTPSSRKTAAWEKVDNKYEWKKEIEESECIICYEPMDMNDRDRIVYELRCKHSFHEQVNTTIILHLLCEWEIGIDYIFGKFVAFFFQCIRKWLKQNQSCPTCRVHSTMDDEFPPLRSWYQTN